MNKVVWLARLLYNRKRMTLAEIREAWRDEDDHGLPMAASTFYANRRKLEYTYHLDMACHGGMYELVMPKNNRAQQLLHSLLADTEAGNAEAHNLRSVAGSAWLPLVSEAIDQQVKLRMHYAPFDKPAYDTVLSPLTMRISEGRFYLVGMSSRHGTIRNFASDRIKQLTCLGEHFTRPADFDAATYFAHSIGGYGGNKWQARTVRVAVTYRVAAYLRSKPLHHSQQEAGNEHAAVDGRPMFDMHVALTPDFVSLLLSYGAELEVLAPESLRRLMLRKAHALQALYATPHSTDAVLPA